MHTGTRHVLKSRASVKRGSFDHSNDYIAGLGLSLCAPRGLTLCALGRYGVQAKEQKSKPLLADEYSRTLLGRARARGGGEVSSSTGQGEQQQLWGADHISPPVAKKGDIVSRLGAAGAAGGSGEGDGSSVFVKVKGLRGEADVRSHFRKIDVLLPDPRKNGPFEYVTQDGADSHVLKFPSAAAAANAAKFGKKAPGDRGQSNVGVVVIAKASEVAKYASRITVDAKRALAGGGGGRGGLEEDGEGEGPCHQCGAVARGGVDETDGQFYCSDCWAQMEGGGEGGEGGEGWEAGEEEAGVAEEDDDYWEQDDAGGGAQEEEAAPALRRGGNNARPVVALQSLVAAAAAAAAQAAGDDDGGGGAPPSLGRHTSALGDEVPPPLAKKTLPLGSGSRPPAAPSKPTGASLAAGFSSAPQAAMEMPPAFGARDKLASAAVSAPSAEAGAAAGGAGAGGDEGEGGGAWGYDVSVISRDGTAPCCTTMLSRKEFERRLQQGRADESGELQGSNHSISPMERDEHGKARFDLAVCRYEFHRGGAGNVFEAWEIRDLETMHMTIDHLQTKWMTTRMIKHCEPAGYVLVYKMTHDVIKAISSDMAYIRRHYPSSLVISGVFERFVASLEKK